MRVSLMVILLFPDRDGRAQCIEIVLALQQENNRELSPFLK